MGRYAPPSLFKDVQKQMIRDEFAKGMSQVALANKYGVARGTIQNAIRGYIKPQKTVKEKRAEITMENWNEMFKESYERLSRRELNGKAKTRIA